MNKKRAGKIECQKPRPTRPPSLRTPQPGTHIPLAPGLSPPSFHVCHPTQSPQRTTGHFPQPPLSPQRTDASARQSESMNKATDRPKSYWVFRFPSVFFWQFPREMQVPRWKNLLSMRNHFALFHSTPVSNAKWKSNWNSDAVRGQQPPKNHIKYVTRQKRADTKKALKDILYYSSSYKRSNNTFRDEDITWVPDGTNSGNPEQKNKQTRSKRSGGKARTHHSSRGNKCKQRKDRFCSDDDEDPETIFQATFGGRCFTWSFRSWEDSHFQKSSYGFEWRDGKANWTRNNRRREWETDENGDTEGESKKSSSLGSMSDRTVLGLPPTGPLKMEDVKSAFRASAMKWHPDKHQGPSQTMAEEKFKLCVDAYQSLCTAISSR